MNRLPASVSSSSLSKRSFSDFTQALQSEPVGEAAPCRTPFGRSERAIKHKAIDVTPINAKRFGDSFIIEEYGKASIHYKKSPEFLGEGVAKRVYKGTVSESGKQPILAAVYELTRSRSDLPKEIWDIAGILQVIRPVDSPEDRIVFARRCIPLDKLDQFTSDSIPKNDTVLFLLNSYKKAATLLKTLHTLGYLHLDIKPQNIGYDPMTENCYLLDCDKLPEMSNIPSHIDRTAGFDSPNKVNPVPVSDLYSLGMSLKKSIESVYLEDADDLCQGIFDDPKEFESFREELADVFTLPDALTSIDLIIRGATRTVRDQRFSFSSEDTTLEGYFDSAISIYSTNNVNDVEVKRCVQEAFFREDSESISISRLRLDEEI